MMKNLLAAVITVSSCLAQMTNFDATKFNGIWYMQSSSLYGSDEMGCIQMAISDPNSSNSE